jgi:hypothetical protein
LAGPLPVVHASLTEPLQVDYAQPTEADRLRPADPLPEGSPDFLRLARKSEAFWSQVSGLRGRIRFLTLDSELRNTDEELQVCRYIHIGQGSQMLLEDLELRSLMYFMATLYFLAICMYEFWEKSGNPGKCVYMICSS